LQPLAVSLLMAFRAERGRRKLTYGNKVATLINGLAGKPGAFSEAIIEFFFCILVIFGLLGGQVNGDHRAQKKQQGQPLKKKCEIKAKIVHDYARWSADYIRNQQ